MKRKDIKLVTVVNPDDGYTAEEWVDITTTYRCNLISKGIKDDLNAK